MYIYGKPSKMAFSQCFVQFTVCYIYSMAQLDALRELGWSYWAGYQHDFKGYVARAWKPRPKPERVKSPGGADASLFNWCVTGFADTLEAAARECAQRAVSESGDGAWWAGLPIERTAEDEWRDRKR